MPDETRSPVDLLRAAAGPNSVVVADRNESMYCVFTVEQGRATADASHRNSERNRAQQLRTVYEQYRTVGQQVELIQDYRARIPEFERQLFIDPIRGLLTQCKAELERPASDKLDDEEFERLRRRLLPPFHYFNTRVNEERQDGSIAGSTAVAEALLTHWFEGGIVGHRMSVATRAINGVLWRVPKSFLTFGARELEYDAKESTPQAERWYRRQGSPKIGWDGKITTARLPLWDRPNDGVYAGVIKPGHPVGSKEAWPRPPFLAALDSCLILEMHRRGELHSLTSMDRTIVLWTIDMERIKQAGLQLADSTDADGNTIPGVASDLKTARDNRRENPGMAMIEYVVGDYLKPVEFTPGKDFLGIAQRTLGAEVALALFAGLRFDPEGNFIQSETERNESIHFDHWRENVIEPVIQQEAYDVLLAENRRWWATSNGLSNDDLDPFVWRSDYAKQKLRGTPRTTRGWQERRRLEAELRLDGEICDLRMLARLTPSGNRPNSRLETLVQFARMGYIGPRTCQESIGADPVLERADLYRMHNDLLTIQEGKKSVFSPPPSNVQVSTSNGETSTSSSRQSPGRVTGTPEDQPRETDVPAAE